MNIRKKLSNINSKTLVYLILFSVTLIVLLWLFQNIFLNVFYEKYQMKSIDNISSVISHTKPEELLSTLEYIAYEKQLCIEIIDTKSDITISYNTLMNGCLLNKNNHSIEEQKRKIIDNEESVKGYKLVNPEYDVKAILMGIKNEDKYVFVFSNLKDINATAMMLRGQYVYIILLASLFATLISYFLSHKITDPIVKITKQAKKFAEGNYEIDFEKNGISEIDDLADTLNHVGEELKKTDDIRRDLMANVSHDLKTPLTMIKAYSEMVRDISYKDEDRRNEHLQIIMDETDRLNILVNDILALSKLQSDAEELDIKEYDLTKEIKAIVKRYEIIKQTEDYKFRIDIPKKCMVLADKQKINQVMYNLINNAINYTGSDNTVSVRVSEEQNNYLVEIIDSGKGIKDEDLNYIWDKYYKNEKNHKRNVIGTGLGLSIVKSVLETHNFEYGVKTKRNEGTTFYFKIKKCK